MGKFRKKPVIVHAIENKGDWAATARQRAEAVVKAAMEGE